jgi:hypothetical protein
MTLVSALILAAMVAAILGLLNAIDRVDAGKLACIGVLCLAAIHALGAL